MTVTRLVLAVMALVEALPAGSGAFIQVTAINHLPEAATRSRFPQDLWKTLWEKCKTVCRYPAFLPEILHFALNECTAVARLRSLGASPAGHACGGGSATTQMAGRREPKLDAQVRKQQLKAMLT